MPLARSGRGNGRFMAREHHVLDGFALLEFLAQQGKPLRRRHQDPDTQSRMM